MKVFKKGCVFVQKKDLVYLYYYASFIPYSLLLKIENILFDFEKDLNEFIKFNKKKEISYFKKIDWILDFNLIHNMEYKEIEDLRKSILSVSDSIINEIKRLPFEKQYKDVILNAKWILNNYKYNSLNEIEINKHEILQKYDKFSKKGLNKSIKSLILKNDIN